MKRRAWSILMVCTGNICRSPVAERLAVARLAQVGCPAGPAVGVPAAGVPAVRVGSAGVHGLSGQPMHPHAAVVLAERGGDPAGFRARALTAGMAEEADLVLCATREHRAAVARLAPRTVRRLFTLREFGRLVACVDSAELRRDLRARALAGRGGSDPAEAGAQAGPDLAAAGAALLAAVTAARGSVPASPGEDDINDPLYGDLAAFRACADLIEEALAPLVRVLGAPELRGAPERSPEPLG